MKSVAQVLEVKQGSRPAVIAVKPGDTVLHAAQVMNRHHVGAVVVEDEAGRVRGIFTERDVLVRIVASGKAPGSTRVSEVMTAPVLTCTPDTPPDHLRSLMREKRIRHVPVVDEEGRATGMVSIGDLNTAESRELCATITYLERYMTTM